LHHTRLFDYVLPDYDPVVIDTCWGLLLIIHILWI